MIVKLSQSVKSKKSLLVLVTFGLFIVIHNFSIKLRTFFIVFAYVIIPFSAKY